MSRDTPPTLRRGDLVGVVCPGFAVRPEPFRAGVDWLRRRGFRIRLGDHVLARDGYFAGPDEARAADLMEMLTDPEVRAVWFGRGGYGSARLLDRIDWRALRRDPKVLVGYSDLTALFSAAGRKTGQVCLLGPTVVELGDPGAYHLPSLRCGLAGAGTAVRFTHRQVLVEGCAEGPLVGGNLSVLAHLLGTPFAPRFDGSILLLEDVGETTYRIDRMLNHLRLSGALDRVSGVVLGGMEPAPPARSFPPDRPIMAVVREFLLPLGVPAIAGFPFGHLRGKVTLPLHAPARLDTSARRLEIAGGRG
jgi:muramoyltetrapeptide carboxypeptidase